MKDDEIIKAFFILTAGMILVATVGAVVVMAAPFVLAGYGAHLYIKWRKDKNDTRAFFDQYARVEALQDEYEFPTMEEYFGFGVRVILGIHEEHGAPPPPDDLLKQAAAAFAEICGNEPQPQLPDRTPSAWAKLKLDEMERYYAAVEDELRTLYRRCAKAISTITLKAPLHRDGFLTLSAHFLDQVDDVRPLVQKVITPFFEDLKFAKWLRDTLDENLCRVSKIPFRELHTTNRPFIWPTEFKGTNRECVHAYLGGTPLAQLFDFTVSYTVPHETRFEHVHICAGTGHGKTQTIQEFIARDLPRVQRGEASVVVIDSQGDLIRNISHLAVFEKELKGKLTLIDPTDIEYPPCLNLFDVNMARIRSYSPLEQEKMLNAVIELYDFVFAGLLGAELTSKQATVFRYVLRLLLHIPDATIHTLRELFEPGGYERYEQYVTQLPPTARAFFETEFQGREFQSTKQQVLRRLWGVLENRTFERMFSHPQNKLDLKAEMDAGKVILVNTAKDLLKQSGTEILGRFFIAMIAQAAQERASQRFRMPTYVYVDEAADYFDQNTEVILREARKYRVGIMLAHQYLGQLAPQLQQAFAANTAIKIVGGVSDRDARQFAQDMRCDPGFIMSQPKGHFAVYAKGTTPAAMSYRAEFGVLESAPKVRDFAPIRKAMRERYAVHYRDVEQEPPRMPAVIETFGESKQAAMDSTQDDWRS